MALRSIDLMVGDWVYAIDINGEKHPCRANNLEYDYTNKRGDFCVDFYGTGYEAEWPDITFNVEPIPITPEILEKNGFYYGCTPNEEDFCSATGAGYPGSGWCYGEGAGEVKIIFPIGSDGGFIRLDDANFDRALELVFTHHIWVHDLQHALRLCGIDKEIVL